MPGWLLALQAGESQPFDLVVQSSRVSKNPGRWLRFLLMLAGDIEPNPGPRAKPTAPQPRGPMNLQIGFAAETSSRMSKCVDAFHRWVCEVLVFNWDVLMQDPATTALSLRAYGMYLFEHGYPRYLLVYAITGMQDLYPQLKPHLNVAWHIDRKWQQHEPGFCRAVLPAVAVRSVLCLGALWKWYPFVGIVLLGFAGMLRPSEMVNLVRRDLVFPRDVAYDMSCMFIHLRNPKTSRFARRQHCRVGDDAIILLAEH